MTDSSFSTKSLTKKENLQVRNSYLHIDPLKSIHMVNYPLLVFSSTRKITSNMVWGCFLMKGETSEFCPWRWNFIEALFISKDLNICTVQKKHMLFIFSAFLFIICRRTWLNIYTKVETIKVKWEGQQGLEDMWKTSNYYTKVNS